MDEAEGLRALNTERFFANRPLARVSKFNNLRVI
jgi:hypothetical protein